MVQQANEGNCFYTLEVAELNSFDLVYGVTEDDNKNYFVDLRCETCSCKYFDIDKYPCVHAVAASNKCFKQDGCPYDMRDLFAFCSPCYLTNVWGMAYRRTIYQVQNRLFQKKLKSCMPCLRNTQNGREDLMKKVIHQLGNVGRRTR